MFSERCPIYRKQFFLTQYSLEEKFVSFINCLTRSDRALQMGCERIIEPVCSFLPI